MILPGKKNCSKNNSFLQKYLPLQKKMVLRVGQIKSIWFDDFAVNQRKISLQQSFFYGKTDDNKKLSDCIWILNY